MNSRRLALTALQRWRTGKEFADSILGELLNTSSLTAQDRGFVTELFYGLLRNLALLDFWIDSLRSGHLDSNTRDLLRLGLYQTFLLETAEHAAVFETVALAPKKARPLVNGVLRNALRSKPTLLASASNASLAVRRSHPQFLIDRWTKNFGAQATEALSEWNNQPAPIYARINRLRTSNEKFLANLTSAAQGEAATLTDQPNFVRLAGVPIAALKAGECYIQDPSTTLACRLLAPQPGERVLDACAAPGGKTACIAELMNNTGFIQACDREDDRIATLRHNLERLGVVIAECVRHDWTKEPTPEATNLFDRILIDAPCSNTGVMRRRADLRWRLRPRDFSLMATEQTRIVRATMPLLKPGGILVYSTCSIEPEENSGVVRTLLDEFPFLELTDEQSVLPFRDGFDGAYAAKMKRA